VKANREISGSGETTDSITVSSQLSLSPYDLGEFGLNYTVPVTVGSLKKTGNEQLSWNFDLSRALSLDSGYGSRLV